MCFLALILYGHSFQLGYYKACYYRCEDYHRYRIYRIDPDYICPKKIEKKVKKSEKRG
jgi:hypothetical protein